MAAKFNIKTKQLWDWISKKDQLLKAQPGRKKLNKGASPKYLALKATLAEWIREQRNNQKAISQYMIQVK
ncbi:22380_t:CDS:1, partial [Dentiscutata erythropus]